MGYDVRIFERSANDIPENQGAGLAAAADLQRYMQKYDATKKPYGVPSPDFQMVNAEGKVTKKMGIAQLFSSWEAVYYRLRANFDGLTSEYCKDVPAESEKEGRAEYLYGNTVVGIREIGQQVSIDYKDRSDATRSLDVDMVIAADGPSSTVRQLLEPAVQRTYAGYCGWRGILPEGEVSEQAMGVFGDLVTFCRIEHSYLISSVTFSYPSAVRTNDRFQIRNTRQKGRVGPGTPLAQLGLVLDVSRKLRGVERRYDR